MEFNLNIIVKFNQTLIDIYQQQQWHNPPLLPITTATTTNKDDVYGLDPLVNELYATYRMNHKDRLEELKAELLSPPLPSESHSISQMKLNRNVILFYIIQASVNEIQQLLVKNKQYKLGILCSLYFKRYDCLMEQCEYLFQYAMPVELIQEYLKTWSLKKQDIFVNALQHNGQFAFTLNQWITVSYELMKQEQSDQAFHFFMKTGNLLQLLKILILNDDEYHIRQWLEMNKLERREMEEPIEDCYEEWIDIFNCIHPHRKKQNCSKNYRKEIKYRIFSLLLHYVPTPLIVAILQYEIEHPVYRSTINLLDLIGMTYNGDRLFHTLRFLKLKENNPHTNPAQSDLYRRGINALGNNRWTVLLNAIRWGSVKTVEYLLNDPLQQIWSSCKCVSAHSTHTPLTLACYNSDERILQLILEHPKTKPFIVKWIWLTEDLVFALTMNCACPKFIKQKFKWLMSMYVFEDKMILEKMKNKLIRSIAEMQRDNANATCLFELIMSLEGQVHEMSLLNLLNVKSSRNIVYFLKIMMHLMKCDQLKENFGNLYIEMLMMKGSINFSCEEQPHQLMELCHFLKNQSSEATFHHEMTKINMSIQHRYLRYCLLMEKKKNITLEQLKSHLLEMKHWNWCLKGCMIVQYSMILEFYQMSVAQPTGALWLLFVMGLFDAPIAIRIKYRLQEQLQPLQPQFIHMDAHRKFMQYVYEFNDKKDRVYRFVYRYVKKWLKIHHRDYGTIKTILNHQIQHFMPNQKVPVLKKGSLKYQEAIEQRNGGHGGRHSGHELINQLIAKRNVEMRRNLLPKVVVMEETTGMNEFVMNNYSIPLFTTMTWATIQHQNELVVSQKIEGKFIYGRLEQYEVVGQQVRIGGKEIILLFDVKMEGNYMERMTKLARYHDYYNQHSTILQNNFIDQKFSSIITSIVEDRRTMVQYLDTCPFLTNWWIKPVFLVKKPAFFKLLEHIDRVPQIFDMIKTNGWVVSTVYEDAIHSYHLKIIANSCLSLRLIMLILPHKVIMGYDSERKVYVTLDWIDTMVSSESGVSSDEIHELNEETLKTMEYELWKFNWCYTKQTWCKEKKCADKMKRATDIKQIQQMTDLLKYQIMPYDIGMKFVQTRRGT